MPLLASFDSVHWLAVPIGILYCLPSIVAASRRCKDTFSILALNILAGWTLIGWLIAFIWSFTSEGRWQRRHV